MGRSSPGRILLVQCRSQREHRPTASVPSLKFQGGYAQASYMLTGESHRYNPASASYGGIVPANPFSLYGGGWGALEIAGRVSMMDLNDKLATATGIAGGQQTGLYGWPELVSQSQRAVHARTICMATYPSRRAPTSSVNTGSSFDAVAMRTQFAF